MRVATETRGLWWGFIGVAAFSLTLPATRAAVAGLDLSREPGAPAPWQNITATNWLQLLSPLPRSAPVSLTNVSARHRLENPAEHAA